MTDLISPEVPEIKDPFIKRLLFLTLPFIVIGIYIFLLYIILIPEKFEIILCLMAINLIPPAGKESVIPLGIAAGIPWYIIGTTTAMMDVAAALFMILNFDLALKIPILGKWIYGFMHKGSAFFLKYKWLEGLSIFGLMIFVMVPFQGSGGIGGTLLGRIMGLPPLQLFIGIAAGSFLGSYILAIGFEFATSVLAINPLYLALVIVALVIIATAANYFYKKMKNSRDS
ncbi:small multi-drug export protein [Methanolacinia petrolearia]|uniref:small multi-drug export protein n=1 Tax=Methanolacinia petrolearia TaxID=54120 RepID=UPI003BADA606